MKGMLTLLVMHVMYCLKRNNNIKVKWHNGMIGIARWGHWFDSVYGRMPVWYGPACSPPDVAFLPPQHLQLCE